MISLAQKHVLVIAGPSACGKSTLIQAMLEDRSVAHRILSACGLDHRLTFGKLNLQRLVNPERLGIHSRKNQVQLVFVQFDTLSRHAKARSLEFEQVLAAAKTVRVLILHIPFYEWLKRMNARTRYPTNLACSPLDAVFGFLGVGSNGWSPSFKAWLILIVSRFSTRLARTIYEANDCRWESYWKQQCGQQWTYFNDPIKGVCTDQMFSLKRIS